MRLILLACLMLTTFTALAACGEPPPHRLLAVRAARLYDGVHDTPIEHPVVLIEGERIVKVGPNLPIPAACQVIDRGGETLLPGFIDCHSHLLLACDPRVDGGVELLREVATLSTAQRATRGVRLAREDLQAGITTVRDLGNSGVNGDVALRDAINRGDCIGPHMGVSTRALAPRGGQFGRLTPAAQPLIEREYVTVDGPASARAAVRQAFYDGADVIKVIVGNGYANLDADELTAIVSEAHRAHKRVAAHAISNEETRLAAAAGVDSIEHAFTAPDDVLMIMAAKGIFLVPTDPSRATSLAIALGHPPTAAELAGAKPDAFLEGCHARLRRAVALGVPIAAGSDAFVNVPGLTRGQASIAMTAAYAEGGMSGARIVRALTGDAARLLGAPLGDQVGRLEAGRLADLVSVADDPAREPLTLEHARWVMIGGATSTPGDEVRKGF